MTNPTITIHNAETGEIVERELNAEELADYNARKAAAEAERLEIESKAELKKAVLAKLGLTADEVSALLG